MAELGPLLMEVAKPLAKVVVSRVTEEIRFIVGFRTELNDLQAKIQSLAGIVDDMTAVPRAVEPWLKKTIRIIHSAEDLLDVLAYEKHRSVVMKRRRPQTKPFSAKIRLSFLPLRQAYLRTKMASWIRRINRKIEAVVKEARSINDLRLLVTQSAFSQSAVRNTVNDDQLLQQVRRNVDTSLFVGRDSDVASAVEMLVGNPTQNSDDNVSCTKHLSVVGIVGFGGIQPFSCAEYMLWSSLLQLFMDRVKFDINFATIFIK